MSEQTCGDFGGRTAKGKPCSNPAGAGHDGDERCFQHPYEEDEYSDKTTKPMELIKKIQSGMINPEQIHPEARRKCIPILLHRGYTQEYIGDLFDRSQSVISDDLKKIRESNGEYAKQISKAELLGELRYEVRRDITELRKQGENYKASQLMFDLLEEFRELGLIEKVPDEMNVSQTMEELEEHDREILERWERKRDKGNDGAE